MPSLTSHKGTGHGTGPMMVRDLHAQLEDTEFRKRMKKLVRLERRLAKKARAGKKQLPGGALA